MHNLKSDTWLEILILLRCQGIHSVLCAVWLIDGSCKKYLMISGPKKELWHVS